MNESNFEMTSSSWRSLYRMSGVVTMLMMVLFLSDTICWFAFGPVPGNAEGWFTLLQNKRIQGLLLLSFPTLFGIMLYYLTFFGLYGTLRQVNAAYASLAALFAFVGLAIVVVTHMGYPLVYLSDHYAAATTEPQKILLLAAGETNIVASNTGMYLGGFFAEGGALLFSLLMLRSNIFSRMTAYLGILGHGLDFTRIVMVLAFLPEDTASVLLMIGGLPQLIWLILVGLRFFKLGQGKSNALPAV